MVWHDGSAWGAGELVLMVAMMALFWGPIILLVVWAVGRFRPSSGREGPSSRGGGDGATAMRILEERFARGDIDADEFQRRREILRGGPGG